MLSEAGVRRAARGPAGGIKAMSSASQLSGRYFHLTAIMSEVMDDIFTQSEVPYFQQYCNDL